MLEAVCIALCVLLCGVLVMVYVHFKEQQQQAYVHGAIAGAALGVTALYVLKAQPDAVGVARDILQTTAANPPKRISNLTDMFADVLLKGKPAKPE